MFASAFPYFEADAELGVLLLHRQALPCQPVAQMSLLTDKPLATSPLTSPKTNRPSLETSETCPCLCIKASLAGSSMLEMWTNDQKVELADSGQGDCKYENSPVAGGFGFRRAQSSLAQRTPIHPILTLIGYLPGPANLHTIHIYAKLPMQISIFNFNMHRALI